MEVNCQLPSKRVAGKPLTINFYSGSLYLPQKLGFSSFLPSQSWQRHEPPQGKPIPYCFLEATLGRLVALQEMRLRHMQRNLFHYP